MTGDMVITSCLLFIVAWKFWRWSPAVAALVIAPFLAIELVFLGANALKIPQGGWFPLLVGTGLFILMRTWRKGTRLLAEISRTGAARRCPSSSAWRRQLGAAGARDGHFPDR